MADEARLNELLDLVEQARSEGDSATEQKAIAAYKSESGAVAKPQKTPVSFMDRAAALPAGINTGLAYTAGIPVDAVANVRDLGKAAIGSLVGAFSKDKGQPIQQGRPGPYGTGKSFDVDEGGKLVPSRTFDRAKIPDWLQIRPRYQDFGTGENIR
jgi:hypothetical protein